MNNIARIQATYITRKVQESERGWLDVIAEEVRKIKGYCVNQNNSNQKNKFNDIITKNKEKNNE